MPTLHGFSYSNYYNMPKHALLYKGVAFEEDLVYPSAAGYNELSPALKVPSLTTDDGKHLSEAAVLCEYIEDAYPEKPLFPSEPVARNQVRQLMHMAELYLELPFRRLLPFSFSGQQAFYKLMVPSILRTNRSLEYHRVHRGVFQRYSFACSTVLLRIFINQLCQFTVHLSKHA